MRRCPEVNRLTFGFGVEEVDAENCTDQDNIVDLF